MGGGGNAPGDADHDGILDSYEKTLIYTYAPVLMFHAEDCTRPVSVDWYLQGSTTYLSHAQNDSYGDWNYWDTVINEGQISGGSDLLGHTRTTKFHGDDGYWDVVEDSGSKYISSHFYLSYQNEDNSTFKCGDASTTTLYAHVTRASPIGAYDVTYHIFYPWNGKLYYSSGVQGYGSHQGDWEMIRVRAYPGDKTKNLVHLSSHDGGGWFIPGVSIMMAEYDGTVNWTTGTHPIVFVARDSHANYAQWGTVDRGNLPDDHSCYSIESCITYRSWSGYYYGTANGTTYNFRTGVPSGSEIVNVGEYAYPAAGMEWINFSGRWGEAVSSSSSDTCIFCQGPFGPKFLPYQPPTIITERPPDQSAVAGEPKKFEFGAGTFDLLWDDMVSMPIDWGDGTTNDIQYWAIGLENQIPSHTYDQPGIYYVSYNLYARHRMGPGETAYTGWDGWVFAVNVIGDADNIPDLVEEGAPNNGDGNGDGTPDSRQANVASLPVAGGSYVTLESPVGTSLADVSAPAVLLDPPSGIEFPLGALDFTIQDVTGPTATVRLFLQPGVEINTFYKYGPTDEDETDHWYEFLYTDHTGARINGNPSLGYTIILHYLDNGRGDNDPATGVIHDPGAPGHDPDSTPPVISANVTGTPGLNGWYRSDVLVSWSVSDEESTIISQEHCGETKIDFDTDRTILRCSATSLGGTSSRHVTIRRDTLAPTITFAERTQPNLNGWNNTEVNVKWNCTDTLSGPAAETVSLDLTGEGANQSATGTCSDIAGNTAQDIQTGISIDLTAPELDPLVMPNPVLLHDLALAAANAKDPLSGVDVENCGLPDTDTVGWKSLTCTASDLAGNSSSADAAYHVIYDFTGFFPPLGSQLLVYEAKAGSTVYETKAGSTVPLKFGLAGDQGLGIFASGYPAVSGVTGCDTWTDPASIKEVMTAGNSGLSYDLETGMYIFRWKTDATWSGTCRWLIVGFIDEMNYPLLFKFK